MTNPAQRRVVSRRDRGGVIACIYNKYYPDFVRIKFKSALKK